jgi:hypothetical protein
LWLALVESSQDLGDIEVGRVLALEQPEPGARRPYLLHCLDKTMRYTTSTSRALSHVIKELETMQAARKARESLALQWMRNQPNDLLNATRGNPTSGARTPLPATALLSKIRKMVSEKDEAV